MAKRKSLLEVAKSAASSRRPMRCWLDDLDDVTRSEVVEGVKHLVNTRGNITAVIAAWQAEGLPITRNKMRETIDKIKRGKL